MPSSLTDTTQGTAHHTRATGSSPEQLLSAILDLPGISKEFVLNCTFGGTQATQGRGQSHFGQGRDTNRSNKKGKGTEDSDLGLGQEEKEALARGAKGSC